MNCKFSALAAVCALAACGSYAEGPASETSRTPPTITYVGADGSVVTHTLDNFTNADWLYENYFGEYELPESFRKDTMTELQMLANGFALTHALGRDVRESMSLYDLYARLMFTEAFAANAVAIRPIKARAVEEVSVSDEVRKLLLEQDRLAEEVKQSPGYIEWRKWISRQEELVVEYNLPYALPGYPKKILAIDEIMGMKPDCVDIGAGACPGTKNPDRKPTVPNIWGPYNHPDIELWPWFDGNLIMGSGPGSSKLADISLQGFWRHVGIVQVRGKRVIVLDAMPRVKDHPPRAGVDIGRWELYRHGYQRVASFVTPNIQTSNTALTRFVEARIGAPFTLLASKGSSASGAYCSLLVWDGYSHAHGYDIDSNGGPIVTPDDIALNSEVVL